LGFSIREAIVLKKTVSGLKGKAGDFFSSGLGSPSVVFSDFSSLGLCSSSSGSFLAFSFSFLPSEVGSLSFLPSEVGSFSFSSIFIFLISSIFF